MTIHSTFQALHDRGEMALIAYLTAGYPDPARFCDALHAVAAGGADLIEIGIPFSDPIADGPTIQHSSQVALQNGVRLPAVLDLLASQRIERPLLLMSYLNPLLAFGRQRLLRSMQAAGACGLIIPDLPVDEASDWSAAAQAAGVDLVLMAAPTSPDDRLRRIGQQTRGFVYAVSVAGVTGARRQISDRLPAFLQRLRRATTNPIAVGFGIAAPDHVAALRGLADGVVVGSRLVDALRSGQDLAGLLRTLKDATRNASCSL